MLHSTLWSNRWSKPGRCSAAMNSLQPSSWAALGAPARRRRLVFRALVPGHVVLGRALYLGDAIALVAAMASRILVMQHLLLCMFSNKSELLCMT